MVPRLVITEDGSSSIYIEELDEHYHSVHGAIQESLHVFIEAGLRQKLNQPEVIHILEIGFGTGLNALLSAHESEKQQHNIVYTALEKFPLDKEVYSQLNYCTLLDIPDCSNIYNILCSSSWETLTIISDHFSLLKLKMDIEDINFTESFDLIYFDAFAPSAQPELWTSAVFNSMYHALKPDGILVTYCAKGEVKRILKSAGFTVEALPGPIGKREMTRAVKK